MFYKSLKNNLKTTKKPYNFVFIFLFLSHSKDGTIEKTKFSRKTTFQEHITPFRLRKQKIA